MLTPDETKVLVGLLVIGLTIGGFLVIIVFGIACALSGYYQSFEHRRREAKVDRAMGGSDAA